MTAPTIPYAHPSDRLLRPRTGRTSGGGFLPHFAAAVAERKSVVYGEENRFEFMKTLLRKSRTGVYFQGVSNWTHDLRDAFDFKLPDRAVRFVRDAGLERVELVLAFDDPRYNIQLPVDERFGASNWSGGKRMEARPGTRARV